MTVLPPLMTFEDEVPELTPEQTAVLNDQWQKFWSVRSQTVDNPSDGSRLPAGSLSHHMGYSPPRLQGTLKSGFDLATSDGLAQALAAPSLLSPFGKRTAGGAGFP